MPATDFTPCRSTVSRHVGPVHEVGQPTVTLGPFFSLRKGIQGWRKRGCPCGRLERYCGFAPRGLASGRSPAASVVRARACRFVYGAPRNQVFHGRCRLSKTKRRSRRLGASWTPELYDIARQCNGTASPRLTVLPRTITRPLVK